jgi:hypothetical protein
MKIGTRSLLFGIHQFLLHPFFVAAGWWKLYGFPRDPRLWVAFFVHDLGYFGKPNMDGPEGELHPIVGAAIMRWLFDTPTMTPAPSPCGRIFGRAVEMVFGDGAEITGGMTWHDFTLFHSRFIAKQYHSPFSRLCIADKLAICLVPRWLYLLCARATGEIHEYKNAAKSRSLVGSPGGQYDARSALLESDASWHTVLVAFMRQWVNEHRDQFYDQWRVH